MLRCVALTADVQRAQGSTIMYPTPVPQVWQCSVCVRQSQVRAAGVGTGEVGDVGDVWEGDVGEDGERGEEGLEGMSSSVMSVECAEQFMGSASVEYKGTLGRRSRTACGRVVKNRSLKSKETTGTRTFIPLFVKNVPHALQSIIHTLCTSGGGCGI